MLIVICFSVIHILVLANKDFYTIFMNTISIFKFNISKYDKNIFIYIKLCNAQDRS